MAMKVACGNGFPLNIPSEIPTGGGGGGTGDYSDLTNKPQINDVTLSGNKSLSDIGAAAAADVSNIQGLIPSDASSSNKLATADDLPGLATTSVPGLVQPDGTSITIADGVISTVGGSGNVQYTETSDILLGTVTWTQSFGGMYYYVAENAYPSNKTLISVCICDWGGLRATDNFLFIPSSTPGNLAILSANDSFADSSSKIKLRLSYI